MEVAISETVQIHYRKHLFTQMGAPKVGQNMGSIKLMLWHHTRGQQMVKVLDCSILELSGLAKMAKPDCCALKSERRRPNSVLNQLSLNHMMKSREMRLTCSDKQESVQDCPVSLGTSIGPVYAGKP